MREPEMVNYRSDLPMEHINPDRGRLARIPRAFHPFWTAGRSLPREGETPAVRYLREAVPDPGEHADPYRSRPVPWLWSRRACSRPVSVRDARACGPPQEKGCMPSFAQAYTNAELAAVADYVIRHYGGKPGRVTPAEVQRQRTGQKSAAPGGAPQRP